MLQEQNTGLFPYLLIEFEVNGPNHAISKTFLLEYLMVDKKNCYLNIIFHTVCVGDNVGLVPGHLHLVHLGLVERQVRRGHRQRHELLLNLNRYN